ncbi:hypothetical protein MKW94_003904 [Papaver nudicaule]|uniref:J domain-containing protein n=1 Tax=Papaver nudicaule TaxID=74823 RepID=A0AA42B4U7_PAPNU|nr:hypothetical protein [Papaver nudicaule]
MVRPMMVAAIRRSVALILMKRNDYVSARNKLLDARRSYPELEYLDELIKVCDMVCTAESASGIDWYSVLQTNKTASEADIEFKYTELMRTLEPAKNKFPEIESALGIIEKAYGVFLKREKRCENKYRRATSLDPSASLRPLDAAQSETVNRKRKTASQSSSGSKRIVNKGSDKSNPICNSHEQPLKRVRSLCGDEWKVTAESQSLSKQRGKVCSQETNWDTADLNEVEDSLGRSSGSPVKAMPHREPGLKFYDLDNHRNADVFAVGQVLAFYDQEKMPRLYGQINRIESCHQKETNSTVKTLYLRWLRPAPINQDEKKWHEVGLPVSCGFFKLGDGKTDKCSIVAGSRLVFSHLVAPFQEDCYSKDLYQIYPREGEIWALYKEWKPFDWCSDPRTRKGCKFQLVEILCDYHIDAGVKVEFLVKVAGDETILQRSGFSFHIGARYLFGFSHNIPVRYAGYMGGLFPGNIIELDPLSMPEDVDLDTVPAESGNRSRANHQNSRFPPTTSDPNICTMNQCAWDVALSSEDQYVKQLNTTILRLVSPRTFEEEKSQADGTSKDENTSSNTLQMGGSTSREKIGNTTAVNDEENVAEENDSESDGVSLDGFMVDESVCGNSSVDSDDAINKLDGKEKVAEEMDSEINGDGFAGFSGNDSECGSSSSDSESKWQIEDDMLSSLEEDPVLCMKAVCALHRQEITRGKFVTGSLHNSNQRFSFFSKFEPVIRGSEMAAFLTDKNPEGDLKKSVEELEMFMPGGLEDCKTLAKFYSAKLFTIYQNQEDPFFGP